MDCCCFALLVFSIRLSNSVSEKVALVLSGFNYRLVLVFTDHDIDFGVVLQVSLLWTVGIEWKQQNTTFLLWLASTVTTRKQTLHKQQATRVP